MSKSDILVNIYMLLYVLIMFCGNTFLLELAPYFIIAAIFLLFLFCMVKGVKREGFFNNKIISLPILLGVFTLFLFFQLSMAYAPSITRTYLFRYILYTMLLLLIADPDVHFKTIKWIKIYSLIVAFSVILMTILNGGKQGGLLGNYQAAGMMLSIASLIFLMDYFYNNKNTTNIIGGMMSILGLLSSGKRMFSILVLLGYLAIYVLLRKDRTLGKWKTAKKFIIITACILVLVIAGLAFVPSVREVFNRFIELSGDTSTFTSGRDILWEKAFEIFKENKMLGIGFANFAVFFEHNYVISGVSAFLTHNIYIGLLAETGLIGFSIMVSFMLAALWQSIKVFKQLRRTDNMQFKYIMTYSLLIQGWFIIYGFSGNGIYDTNEFFFYVMSIAAMISVKYRFRSLKGVNDEN